ncbi:MAG: hypothetical protein HZB26_25190 [Candidatus Hydrogenedentes bacterium]|nr:hypothetical protein [Candidatus Hydrogenedentota bacterium]
MLSKKLKILAATVVAVIVLTPIAVSLFRSKVVLVGGQVVTLVTRAPAFVDDPDALGSWVSVGFTQTIEEFVPERTILTENPYVPGVEFRADGKTSGPWLWSKGTLWHPWDRTLATYTIQTIKGVPFLFVEWTSPELYGRPRFNVLKKGEFSTPHRTVAVTTEAPAFVDDPDMIGSWTSVDYVQTIEEFVPGKKAFSGDLFLKELQVKPDGRTSGPWRWSKGIVWRPGDQVRGKYTVKTMNNTQFLFMEWINGDVTNRGKAPWFYVMTKN